MDFFTREALETLAQMQDDACVSLYMPTYHVEAELSQNPIRLKNLLRKARQQLKRAGRRDPDVEALLRPAYELLERPAAWGTLGDGMAAFLCPSASFFFRIPLTPEELVVTGRRFHLKPLFPLLASNNRFYVLALSQNRVKLYQGTHQAINEVHVQDVPKSLAETLAYETPVRSLQAHTGARAGNRHDAIFHGQGAQSEDERPQEPLRRFFHEIDGGLRDVLRDEQAPLLLAGVEYYLPIFREVNSYPYLVQDDILAGNPDHLAPHQLHGRAWKAVEPLFLAAQTASLKQFHQARRQDGLTSDDLKEIVPAAVFSRIDTLFVPVGVHRWGRYDPESNAVTIHETQQPGDDDLFDLAAVQTYLNGGTVHAMKPANMPVESGVAATFRYPAQVEALEA